MSGSEARLKAIDAVTNYTPISDPLSFKDVSSGEIFRRTGAIVRVDVSLAPGFES